MDLEGAEEGLERLRRGLDREVLPISALTGQGLPELRRRILEMLEELWRRPIKRPAPEL
jgi:50S ribosomal subunit-associated GTPase HflX